MAWVLLLHGRVAQAVVLYMAVVGIWGVVATLRGGKVSGSYLGALAIAEILVCVQALLGILMLPSGANPRQPIHVLYGIAILLPIPLAYTLGQRLGPARLQLGTAIACLFAAGLALRAIGTAG